MTVLGAGVALVTELVLAFSSVFWIFEPLNDLMPKFFIQAPAHIQPILAAHCNSTDKHCPAHQINNKGDTRVYRKNGQGYLS